VVWCSASRIAITIEFTIEFNFLKKSAVFCDTILTWWRSAGHTVEVGLKFHDINNIQRQCWVAAPADPPSGLGSGGGSFYWEGSVECFGTKNAR
jgi:hypothetical protein